MYSDDHCPSGQVISLANRWKKYIDNITPPYKRRALASRPLKEKKNRKR